MPKLIFVPMALGLIWLMATIQARRSGQSNVVLDAVAFVASGVSTGGRDVIDWAARMKQSLTSGSELLVDRDRLKSENGQLKLQLERLGQIESEYIKYRDILGLPNIKTDRAIVSDVKFWYPSVESASISIDNSAHKITRNSTVRTTQGLIGKVVITGPLYAKVRLIQDRDSHVGVKVLRSGTFIGTGILDGRGANKEPLLHFVRPELMLSPGDQVVTSGEGGVFRSDIPVGVIRSTSLGAGGIERIAVVAPYAENPVTIRTVIALNPLVGDEALEDKR
jgi:rod shape-determining protein MreC